MLFRSVTKTIAETDSDGTTHYITKLADAYKVSGDSFYMQDSKAVLPLGTLTVEETKAPNGYLLEGAYMQAGDKSEQIKGLYVTQITEDGDLAVLSGSNQFSVSDKVIRGGPKPCWRSRPQTSDPITASLAMRLKRVTSLPRDRKSTRLNSSH